MKSKMVLKAFILGNLRQFKNNSVNQNNAPILIKLLAVKVNENEKIVFTLCEELAKEGRVEIIKNKFARLK